VDLASLGLHLIWRDCEKFKKGRHLGISNALDGTEDDVNWQEAETGDNNVNDSSASEGKSYLSSDDEN
jgi:hypothetical protein